MADVKLPRLDENDKLPDKYMPQSVADVATALDNAKTIDDALMSGIIADGTSATAAQLSATTADLVAEQMPAVLADRPEIVAEAASFAQSKAGVVLKGDDISLTKYEPLQPADGAENAVALDVFGRPTWLDMDPSTLGPGANAVPAIRVAAGVVGVEGIGAARVDQSGATDFTEAREDGSPTVQAAELIAIRRPDVRGSISRLAAPGLALYATPRDASAFVRARPDATRIALHGESHTSGIASRLQAMKDGTPAAGTPSSVTSYVQAHLSGVTVVNLAQGGSNSTDMSWRAGAITPAFTITAGGTTISGSTWTYLTPSAITSARTDSANGVAGVLSYRTAAGAGQVAGMLWRLTDADGKGWRFSATTSGADITGVIPGSIRFVSENLALHGDAVTVLGSGINNLVRQPGETVDQAIGRALADYAAVIESRTTVTREVLIVGSLTRPQDRPSPITGTTVLTGSDNPQAGYAIVARLERELRAAWPQWYVGRRDYVNRQLLTDMGLTPTAADTAAMLNDTIPAQITSDNQHLTPAAGDWEAYFVLKSLVDRNQIK